MLQCICVSCSLVVITEYVESIGGARTAHSSGIVVRPIYWLVDAEILFAAKNDVASAAVTTSGVGCYGDDTHLWIYPRI